MPRIANTNIDTHIASEASAWSQRSVQHYQQQCVKRTLWTQMAHYMQNGELLEFVDMQRAICERLFISSEQ